MRNNHKSRPHIIETDMPNTRTGPAITNIFAAIPSTKPSLLNSMAGDTIEFAKPVLGTIEPAPALFPIRSYTPSPVSNALKNTNVIDAKDDAFSVSSPRYPYKFISPCPRVQIKPPIKNAIGMVK